MKYSPSSRDALDAHCREVIRSCLNIVEQHGDTYVAIHKDDEIDCVVLVSMIRSYEDYWAMPRNLPRGHEFFIGYYQTQRAIHHHVAFIHTDQSCFLSTHLFDQGYRIFLHFKSGTLTEVERGENPALPVNVT